MDKINNKCEFCGRSVRDDIHLYDSSLGPIGIRECALQDLNKEQIRLLNNIILILKNIESNQ